MKLVSVYQRYTSQCWNDTYTKANAAYALGGPEQAITMLNTNLDLNISDYATADFSALVEVIDDLGGLDIPLSYAEIEHMNNYCVETSEDRKGLYTDRTSGPNRKISRQFSMNLSSEWCTGNFLLPYPLYSKPGYGTYRASETCDPDDR